MKANSISLWVAIVTLPMLTARPLSAAEETPEVVSTVAFKQGKVLAPKEGKTMETTNDVLVAGIVLVQTNGIFTVNKGKERQLREGQIIGADRMLTSADGSVVPVTDHLMVKNGRVLLVKDGAPLLLTAEFRLPDGSRVTPTPTSARRTENCSGCSTAS